MKQPINEIRRMQQLAGLIKESQLNENSFGPDSNFQWKTSPIHPESMVKDEEEGDTMTKEEFWRDNVTGRDPEEATPSYGSLQPNGTWLFSWDAGEFSGFVEGDDFTV